mgnify:CR=1 FL=1
MDKSREKQRIRVEVVPDADAPETKKAPLWKNRRAAVAIAAAVCVVMTALGAHRSVNAQRSAVERAFYQGADGTGYSISRLLGDRVEYAGYLVKVASQYPELSDETEAVASAAGELQSAKGAQAGGEANRALTDAVTALDLAMQSAELSERDEQYRSEYTADLAGCNLKISHMTPEYNELAREFNDGTLGAFPLGTLARLTGVKSAEEYHG